ncbi:alpha/beta hydrolase [Paraconexibacter algicola]|uniref:Esterase n=1 Tax=Paraconexibacter algicola TaxID=2133960 RepID=A0A2T4UGF2_9ACTN|nr:alpha/beta hydrolase fold domain-containing protein [Paraconexibacter algicola]PTL58279.1 esterase [Paraconexibacter algicola]
MTTTLEVPEAVRAAQEAANAALARMPHPDPREPAGLAALRAAPPAGPRHPAARDVVRDGLRLRVLPPPGEAAGALVRVHGGGFLLGSPEHDDPVNARLARACAVRVLAPAYRRAPEAPVSAAVNDVGTALRAAATGDPALPLLVAGVSAGAHLALRALLALRDGGDPLLARVAGAHLDCGRYDLLGTPSARRADDRTLLLTGTWLTAFREVAFPGADRAALRAASPLHADLRGLPPLLLTVGDLDPLLDDTLLLADAVRAAGGEASVLRLPHAPHSVLGSGTPLADLALGHVERWLRARLRAAPLR